MHVFDTSDTNNQKGKENKTVGDPTEGVDDESILEFLPFDLIDEDVVL